MLLLCLSRPSKWESSPARTAQPGLSGSTTASSPEQAAAAAGSSRDHELKALADSYGLTSVPAAALGPCLVSESDDDESSGCAVVSEAEVEAEDEQVSAEPASSSAKPAASRVAPVSRASGKAKL